MKLQMFGTVGRATVPAETGRHGGRPYDSTRPELLFRFDWTLAASGDARMKLLIVGTANRRISNIECRSVESLRSVFFKTDRIHLFDVRCLSVSFSIWQDLFLSGGSAKP